MHISELLENKGARVYAVGPEWSVRETAGLIAARNIGTTVVLDPGGALVGIISERDIVRALSEQGAAVLDLKIGDVMTRSVVTCTPDDTVAHAMSLMAANRIRHLPVVGDGGILGVISVRDVLECRLEGLEASFAALMNAKRASARARQAAERSNRTKNEFLAHIEHGFSGPLDAIVGYAEHLKTRPDREVETAEQQECLREIERNGRLLQQTIEDLLLLSRLQNKELEPSDQTGRLADAIAACIDLLRDRAERKGVRLHAEASAMLPGLSADPPMVARMLRTLVTNAIDFTADGGIVSIGCAVHGDGGIRIAVTDTGIGIAPENLAKVLDPFYRIPGSLARSREGVGLGLPLAKAMIEAHGGTLAIDSKLGIGTTATLRFPPSRTVGAIAGLPDKRAAA